MHPPGGLYYRWYFHLVKLNAKKKKKVKNYLNRVRFEGAVENLRVSHLLARLGADCTKMLLPRRVRIQHRPRRAVLSLIAHLPAGFFSIPIL